MIEIPKNIFVDYTVESISYKLDPVLELVLERVRLRSRIRIAWLRKIWTEMNDRGGRNEEFSYHSEVDGFLQDADTPEAEFEWLQNETGIRQWLEALEGIEQALAADKKSRLYHLCNTFGLSDPEKDIIQACLALAIDPNLARVFAYLQDHKARTYVTETLVARLFGHGRYLLTGTTSPLKTWGLTDETATGQGELQRLEFDPFVKNWLLGMDGLDGPLAEIAIKPAFHEPLSNWPVDKAVDWIRRMTTGGEEKRLRLIIAGDEGSGRRSFAGIVSRRLGFPLLILDSDRVAETHWQQTFMRAQRYAFINQCAVAWYGSGMHERYWPANIPCFPVQFVIEELDGYVSPSPQFIDCRLEIPVISITERKSLWLKHVAAAVNWPNEALEEITRHNRINIGQITAIGKKPKPGTIAEALDELHVSSGHRLDKLAQQMNCPFTWDDLVISERNKQDLEDFTYEATERAQFWERPEAQRLFPLGKGLIALFTGVPGTGKTMAAQVIAASLHLELFRVDLSTIVSKYVGETSKNMERILSRASRMDIVLLFDEADALFGKRTEIKDAHDRFANTDTNYLLQAIEQYPGVIIMASNKRANIDAGFTRRLRFMIEFPKPDAAQRLQLWRQITGELVGVESALLLDKDLTKLSEILEVTGAQIKLSVLSAIFMAKREGKNIGTEHIIRGLERELMKEGRGLGRQVQETFNR